MIQDFIAQVQNKEDLDFHSMQSAFELIMTGEVDDLAIESFLLALNDKGIKETEITAAARVMKEKSLTFLLGDGDHIDTCGTGGTGIHTLLFYWGMGIILILAAPEGLAFILLIAPLHHLLLLLQVVLPLQNMVIKLFQVNQEALIF